VLVVEDGDDDVRIACAIAILGEEICTGENLETEVGEWEFAR